MSELEAEVHSTRQEMRRMEDRNMELCESPFINDVLERQQLVNKVVTCCILMLVPYAFFGVLGANDWEVHMF